MSLQHLFNEFYWSVLPVGDVHYRIAFSSFNPTASGLITLFNYAHVCVCVCGVGMYAASSGNELSEWRKEWLKRWLVAIEFWWSDARECRFIAMRCDWVLDVRGHVRLPSAWMCRTLCGKCKIYANYFWTFPRVFLDCVMCHSIWLGCIVWCELMDRPSEFGWHVAFVEIGTVRWTVDWFGSSALLISHLPRWNIHYIIGLPE